MSTHASGRMGVREPRSGEKRPSTEIQKLEKGARGREAKSKNGHPSRADTGLRKF